MWHRIMNLGTASCSVLIARWGINCRNGKQVVTSMLSSRALSGTWCGLCFKSIINTNKDKNQLYFSEKLFLLFVCCFPGDQTQGFATYWTGALSLSSIPSPDFIFTTYNSGQWGKTQYRQCQYILVLGPECKCNNLRNSFPSTCLCFSPMVNENLCTDLLE